MQKLIMVTGGARSGKSLFAEEKAKELGNNVLYIATSKPIDEEMVQRIAKHRAQRPSEWETYEGYRDFKAVLVDLTHGKDAVLLDCITIMLTNLMMDETYDWDSLTKEKVSAIENSIKEQVEELINSAKSSWVPFIFVTNEVGLGLVPPSKMGRDFRDIAGRINQILAKACDEVYFCVSGIPMKVK